MIPAIPHCHASGSSTAVPARTLAGGPQQASTYHSANCIVILSHKTSKNLRSPHRYHPQRLTGFPQFQSIPFLKTCAYAEIGKDLHQRCKSSLTSAPTAFTPHPLLVQFSPLEFSGMAEHDPRLFFASARQNSPSLRLARSTTLSSTVVLPIRTSVPTKGETKANQ